MKNVLVPQGLVSNAEILYSMLLQKEQPRRRLLKPDKSLLETDQHNVFSRRVKHLPTLPLGRSPLHLRLFTLSLSSCWSPLVFMVFQLQPHSCPTGVRIFLWSSCMSPFILSIPATFPLLFSLPAGISLFFGPSGAPVLHCLPVRSPPRSQSPGRSLNPPWSCRSPIHS